MSNKKFVCPKDNSKCEKFARGFFCPYAPIEILKNRRFAIDCPFAPEEMWLDFKRRAERIEYWFDYERKEDVKVESK